MLKGHHHNPRYLYINLFELLLIWRWNTSTISFSLLNKQYYIKLSGFFNSIFLLVGPTLSKEEKELERRKELKKIRVKYGLQVRKLNIVTCAKLCVWFCVKLPLDQHAVLSRSVMSDSLRPHGL